MAVSLLDVILGRLGLDRKPRRFRFSDIPAEAGAYARAFPGYRPFAPAGDVYIDGLVKPSQARAGCAVLLAAKTDRLAEIERLLAAEGLGTAAEPAAWNTIGAWIAREIEENREPWCHGLGQPPLLSYPFRPLWHGLLIDLSLLLGEHIIRRATTPSAWAYGGDLDPPTWIERAYPVVARAAPGPQSAPAPAYDAFDILHIWALHALRRRLGVETRPGALLGGILRYADEPQPDPAPAAEELEAYLQDYLNAHGDLPPIQELTSYMVDCGFGWDDLPPRFKAMLDARDRRR